MSKVKAHPSDPFSCLKKAGRSANKVNAILSSLHLTIIFSCHSYFHLPKINIYLQLGKYLTSSFTFTAKFWKEDKVFSKPISHCHTIIWVVLEQRPSKRHWLLTRRGFLLTYTAMEPSLQTSGSSKKLRLSPPNLWGTKLLVFINHLLKRLQQFEAFPPRFKKKPVSAKIIMFLTFLLGKRCYQGWHWDPGYVENDGFPKQRLVFLRTSTYYNYSKFKHFVPSKCVVSVKHPFAEPRKSIEEVFLEVHRRSVFGSLCKKCFCISKKEIKYLATTLQCHWTVKISNNENIVLFQEKKMKAIQHLDLYENWCIQDDY